MKTLFAIITIAVLSAFTKNNAPVNCAIDVNTSTIKWTGHAQTGVYAPSGTIQIKSGSLVIDNDKVVKADITIDMNTIHHENPQMEGHLKGPDFFNVEKFPEAKFTLKAIANGIAKGDLIIKGTSHPVSFPVAVNKKGNRVEVTVKLQIDRTLYGIKYNSASYFQDLGSYAIKNEFDLDIMLIGIIG